MSVEENKALGQRFVENGYQEGMRGNVDVGACAKADVLNASVVAASARVLRSRIVIFPPESEVRCFDPNRAVQGA